MSLTVWLLFHIFVCHFINMPFHQLAISPTCHFIYMTKVIYGSTFIKYISSRIYTIIVFKVIIYFIDCVAAISFICLSFHELVLLSTCCFVNLSLHKLAISRTCCLINLPFHHFAISTTYHFIDLPFHRLAIS